MEPVQFNFTLNLHDLDAPKTTYKIPLFHPTVLPACTTTSSCINQNAKISSELEKLPGQGDGAAVCKLQKKMKRKRECNDKYATVYLNKLSARFQDQPENIQGFKTVMADIIGHTDRDQSGRLKDIPGDTLDRIAAIFEGHDDLLRDINSFLPPSHQLSLDDEEEENEEDAAEEKEPGLKDAVDFFKKVWILRGMDFYEAFLRTLFPLKTGSRNPDYVYRDALALLEGEPDLLQGFYRFLPASKSIPLAYHVPYSQGLDVNNKRAVLVKAVKEQKHSENLEVVEEIDHKKRNFVNKAGGVVAGGGESVIKKCMSDGLGFFGKVKERLSCNFRYERFLKLLFYYTKEKFGESEWKTMVATMIGNHSDLMDELNDFMVKFKNMPESRRCERRDRKRAKHESQVLNDELVSVASRTGDYSSNIRNQNQRQKIMVQCNDDRDEIDMLFTWFKSAVEYAEELGDGNDEGKVTKGKRIHFLRCVERLYNDQGLEVLDVFDNNPQHALPILRHRLKQKLEELKHWRDDYEKLWDEVVSRVY